MAGVSDCLEGDTDCLYMEIDPRRRSDSRACHTVCESGFVLFLQYKPPHATSSPDGFTTWGSHFNVGASRTARYEEDGQIDK